MPRTPAPLLALFLAFSIPAFAPAAQNLLPGAIQPGSIQISLKTVATGLNAPDYGFSPPGDPNDLWVTDEAGTMSVISNGVLQSTPALNTSSLLVSLVPSYDERGLLSVAFDPNFNNAGQPGYHTIYTYTSEPTNGTSTFQVEPGTLTGPLDHQNVVSAWTVEASNPNVVNPTSRRILLTLDAPALNHNGGQLAFGPDGDLYISDGDGGTANDTGSGHNASIGNGQDTNVALGKILRIDVHGDNSANGQYGIPPTNPFVKGGGLPEIYAYGFRNPYRFSFDTANGNLIVGDVGQNEVEEADQVVSGGNYGWPIKEGSFLFNRTGPNAGTDQTPNSPGSPSNLIDPLIEYDHNSGGSAIIGGFVYHGSAIPALDNMYVFGDLARPGGFGRLMYANLSTGKIFDFGFLGTSLGSAYIKGFGEDGNGNIYVMTSANYGPTGTTGQVLEITPEPASLSLLALLAPAVLRRRPAR